MNPFSLLMFGIPLLGAVAVAGYVIYQYSDFAEPQQYPTSKSSRSSMECTICKSTINIDSSRTLPCGCRFHRGCIKKFLVENETKKCPVCQKFL